jgi:hypothetical protein
MKAWSLLLTVFLVAIQTAGAFSSTPAVQRVVLRGGFNSILGGYAAAGLGFGLSAGTLLILGATFTETLGLEPLLSLESTANLGSGWSVSLTASRGDIVGSYRVDRLPEVSFIYGRAIPGTLLNLGLEAGVGYFAVHPTGARGVRGVLAAQLGTSPIHLGPVLTANISTGYRQYLYADRAPHGAWWTSIQLSATPLSAVTTTFTYYRQDITGASPLLFDAMGNAHHVAGSATFRLGQTVTVQHSQTYDLVSRTIAARAYSMTLSFVRGQTAGVGWDDISRSASISYSRPDLGAFVVAWEIPTQRISFSFTR